jgi:hypothetical protein
MRAGLARTLNHALTKFHRRMIAASNWIPLQQGRSKHSLEKAYVIELPGTRSSCMTRIPGSSFYDSVGFF